MSKIMSEYIIGSQPATNYLTFDTNTNQLYLNTENSTSPITSARRNNNI